jgi:DNA-binding response OmpR family regulator
MAQKILIVDDEPHIRELVGAVLESEGYDVDRAEDGPNALEKLKKNKYSLVVLDMMMPGMSGREVCEKIRETDKKQKVVFLTVARFSETGKNVLDELNVSDYLTKPFENDDLILRIKKILA